jgi:hypothetical protein
MSCTTPAQAFAADFATFAAEVSAYFSPIVFPHLCDIWKLVPLTHDPTTKILTNATQVYALVVQGQICRHDPTPEEDKPSDFGRTKDIGLFTMDQFIFPSGVDIGDNYAIVFMTPGDNFQKVWKTQGNAQSDNLSTKTPLPRRMVYAVRGPVPNGVTNPSRYGF